MTRLANLGIETALAALCIIPILLIANKWLFKSKKKTICYIIVALYLSAIYTVVGLPSILYFRFELNTNFIPIIGMIGDLKNSLLNVILFVPLGIILPILWSKYSSIKRVLLLSLGVSLTIEILQIFTFRATDVNDLITNTIGAVCGCVIAKCLLLKQTLITPDSNSRDLYVLIATVFAIMFFVHPFISSIVWNLTL